MPDQAALDAFIAIKADIDEMIDQLMDLSDDHFNCVPDTVTWRHVGTLEILASAIKHVLDKASEKWGHAK